MKLTKASLTKRVKELSQISGTRRGPQPRLFKEDFQEDFVQAILDCHGNGKKVYEQMNKIGHNISYKQTHEYMRWILGKYPGLGRPAKYLGAPRQKA